MPKAENLVGLLPTISPVAAATVAADDIMKQNIETRRHSPGISPRGRREKPAGQESG